MKETNPELYVAEKYGRNGRNEAKSKTNYSSFEREGYSKCYIRTTVSEKKLGKNEYNFDLNVGMSCDR